MIRVKKLSQLLPRFEAPAEETNDLSDKHDSVAQKKKKKGSGGFQAMGLSMPVLKGIKKRGYKQPTHIQRTTIPLALDGKDVVGLAKTGSGKTACFVLPILEKLIAPTNKAVPGKNFRALILSPTKELALKTLMFVRKLGQFTGLMSAAILGGESVEQHFSIISGTAPDIVVATPGRFLHICREMNLQLDNIKVIVFDEADSLFELSFGEEVQEIVARLPSSRQTLLFSATQPIMLPEFARSSFPDPVLTGLNIDWKLPSTLWLGWIAVRAESRTASLLCLLDKVLTEKTPQAVVFAATRHHVEHLHLILQKAGILSTYAYSGIDRKKALGRFTNKKCSVLIVTDVAARGLDLPALDTVINYNFPATPKLFVHRVGRSARAGRAGRAFSLVAAEDIAHLLDLQLFLGTELRAPGDLTGRGAQCPSGVWGAVPTAALELRHQDVIAWERDYKEIEDAARVCARGWQQYVRWREPASAAGNKRAKGLLLPTTTHPFLVGDGDEADNHLVQQINNTTPKRVRLEQAAKNNCLKYLEIKAKKHAHGKTVQKTTENEKLQARQPPAITSGPTPSASTGASSTPSTSGRRRLKAPRRLPPKCRRAQFSSERQKKNLLVDSGSEDEERAFDSDKENDAGADDEEYVREHTDYELLKAARQLRNVLIEEQELGGQERSEPVQGEKGLQQERGVMELEGCNPERDAEGQAADPPVSTLELPAADPTLPALQLPDADSPLHVLQLPDSDSSLPALQLPDSDIPLPALQLPDSDPPLPALQLPDSDPPLLVLQLTDANPPLPALQLPDSDPPLIVLQLTDSDPLLPALQLPDTDSPVPAQEDEEGQGLVQEGAIGRVEFGGAERPFNDNFSWSEDFSTFTAQEEVYVKNPGPLTNKTDPTDLFLEIWDLEIVSYMVEEYNRYGLQFIEWTAQTENGLNEHLLTWKETNVEEMYRFLSILNLMALGKFDRIDEYWQIGILGMPEFRAIMSRNRFSYMMRFLHFVNNHDLDSNVRSYDRKIAKIRPILDHCNKKFSSWYVPQRHLSLDESLLLWKGRLSWKQCNRLKAARFGMKSFDLCEAQTGYLLRTIIYTGKDSSMTDGAVDGFGDSTSKVVLEIMDGFLNTGHCLVMDNWYNQLPLTRHLKSRGTDVIGTLNRRRQHVPPKIKNLDERHTERGSQMALHCGDIALVTWKDVKQVTTISTYHNDERVRCQRGGESTSKPKVVVEYNKYMGGVDLKDQKLSHFHFERKRGMKWYMKMFRRLLNTSLLNAYVIYTKQPLQSMLTHRKFRMSVAEGLLRRFPLQKVPRPRPQAAPINDSLRLDNNGHYPGHTPSVEDASRKHARRTCVRCIVKGKRSAATTVCKKCDVALCIVPCFEEYHTLAKL